MLFRLGLPLVGVVFALHFAHALPFDEPKPQEPAKKEDAANKPTEFMRFVKNPDGSATLETAIVRYKDKDGNIVDLIGAVHVADPPYYATLNKVFRSYDALLYEMVKPKGMEMPSKHEELGSEDDKAKKTDGKAKVEKDGKEPDPAESTRRSGSWVGQFQRLLKDVLNLQFQLDGIDYGAKNFVHADLDAETFAKKQEERGESILLLMLKASLDQASKAGANLDTAKDSMTQQIQLMMSLFSKDRSKALKRILGEQFGDLEKVSAGFEKGPRGEESVLVIERNKACLSVLKEELAKGKKRIGIFYGAAHFPDMERRLISEFGFQKTSQDWMVAWSIE